MQVANFRVVGRGFHRHWAIQTGIIEGLYRLDEAQTRILVEQSFEPSAVPPCGTGQDSDNLLAMLQDHMMALDAIYGEIRVGRSAIRQLHQVIVAHQPTYRAMNQFGQWFDATLHAGAFKTLPNYPTPPTCYASSQSADPKIPALAASRPRPSPTANQAQAKILCKAAPAREPKTGHQILLRNRHRGYKYEL